MKEKKQPLLTAENLCLGFGRGKDRRMALSGLSFQVEEGELVGIVGESGSGKTMTALAVMGLLPRDARIFSGSVRFLGRELLSLTEKERRSLKGDQMAMIFQDPMSSLNPVLTIGNQVEEMLALHSRETKKARYEQTLAMLSEAGLKEPALLYGRYPHQLSGGMRQRVMIAMAMICRPRLLIADEPTTALDVTIQAQILSLIKKLNQDLKISVLLISHDLGVVKSICDRALVVKEGKLVEEGRVHDLFYHPRETYTRKLLEAVPRRDHTEKRLSEQERRLEELEKRETLLQVEHLDGFYPEDRNGFPLGKRNKQVLYDISFTIRRGETLGIVGESGSGKSTLARAVTGLLKDWNGRIRHACSAPLMVFQDSYASLNPAKKVEQLLEEPLKIRAKLDRRERAQAVREMLREVGLQEECLGRYVSQLSGGQRQRVGIACAAILRPELIVLDEPVSSLDVTVQAQILALLQSLREKFDLAYLFISHDLNVIYQMCDRVGVMREGRLVELAGSRELYENPRDSYTKKLLASIPAF